MDDVYLRDWNETLQAAQMTTPQKNISAGIISGSSNPSQACVYLRNTMFTDYFVFSTKETISFVILELSEKPISFTLTTEYSESIGLHET